jgi:CheY-like chemotaxis protein
MPPARVLLVDDDPWIGRTVSALLARRGHRVELLTDGEAALARSRAQPPDLILLDVMLPRLDGWQVLQALRASPELRAVPVVLLTALAGDDERLRALRLGADDFVTKPFRFEELDLRVQRALGKRRGHTVESTVAHSAPGGDPAGTAPSPVPQPAPAQTDTLPIDDPLGPVGAGAAARSGVHGTLDQLGLGSLLAMFDMERKTGILSLRRAGARGRLLCRDGQIVRAELLSDDSPVTRRGVEAVTAMLTWSDGRFDFIPSAIDTADELGVRTTHLLMEAARQADEAARPQREVS